MTRQELLRRITVDPGIFGGKPIIRGMRISVPDLTAEDLRACLAWASPERDL